MKKYIALVLLLLISLLNPLPIQANVGGSISGGGTINSGASFSVSISVSTDLTAQAVQAYISYDSSKLTITGSSGNSNYNLTAGATSFLLDSPSTAQTGSFNVVNITFQATSSFTAGTSTSITLSRIEVSDGVSFQSGGSGSVTVNIAQALSSDNTLSALAVDGSNVLSSLAYSTDNASATITATANHSGASISGTGTKTLNYGANTFNVVVTAENGSTKTYSVSITRNDTRSTVNTLSALTVNGTNVLSSLSTSTDSASVVVAATATDSKATIEGTGTKTLNYGSNSFNIVVTAENGSKKTYTLTITRNDTRSTDNTLSALTVNGTSVISSLAYSTDDASITIAASVNDAKASVSGTGTKSLAYGVNTFNIVVTAENSTTKTYSVKVTRNDNRSTVNTVSSLTVDGSSVEGFSNTKTYYDLGSTEATSITIAAERTDTKSSITGTGTKTLAYGTNTFKVVVTAENTDVKTYTIVIKKTDTRDTDSSLKDLSLEGVDLNFDAKELYYYAVVENGVSTIDISATPNQSSATVSGAGTKSLAIYENTFNIVVTAENQSKTTYSIKIMRKDAKGFLGDVSDNNNLSTLSIENYDLDFSNSLINYEISIPLEETSIVVNAVAEDAAATVTINYPESLKLGKNTITVDVLSESFELKTFTITVIRGANIEELGQEDMAKFIDELVAEDLILSISNGEVIDTTLLNKITEMGKKLKIIVNDPALGNIANWYINADSIQSLKDLVFGLGYGSDYSKQLDELSNFAPKLVLNLEYSGPIGSGVFLEADVSDQFVNGDIVTVYHFDPLKNRFSLIAKDVKVIDGWITFEPGHASEFVISKAEFYTFPISYKILFAIAVIQFLAMLMVVFVIFGTDYRKWFKKSMKQRKMKTSSR